MADDAVRWLLEPDEVNSGVRFLALRDLVGLAPDDSELLAAQRGAMASGPVPAILKAQETEGFWVKPGPGYAPKYRGTVWSMIFLAQLGADGNDERVRRGAEYVLEHTQADDGAFAINGRVSTSIHCLWGNLTWALLELGFGGDDRVKRAVDGLARSITGNGYDWYRRGGVQGPGFVCSANYELPCAWGAVRALWALGRVPEAQRTVAVREAIEACAQFLLSYDVACANYPHKDRISSRWFQFGFPLAYVTDVLHNLEALAQVGYGDDKRLGSALDLVLSKRDEHGRWSMEHGYQGKMWVDVEVKRQPSKWVTLRALRLLSRISGGHSGA